MGLWERARYFFDRDKFERELDDELLAHIETRTAELRRAGLPAEDAQRQARLEFGNISRSKEATRRAWGFTTLEGIAQDLRYGVRRLRKSPGFAATAILSLALGIGANTAIFQLLNAVRLQSLPVHDPQQLVEIVIPGNQQFGVHGNWDAVTYPLWEQIRDHQDIFSGVFAWSIDNFPLGEGEDTQSVRIAWVSGEAFSNLGVQAASGRLLSPADDRKGCANTAVLGHGFWQRHFGGQESAVGSRITLNDAPFSIVGVTSPEFFGLEVGRPFDIAIPFCAAGNMPRSGLGLRYAFWLGVMGRLKPGVTAAQAAQQLEARSAAWFQAVAPTGYDASSMKTWNRFRMTAKPSPRGMSPLRNSYETSLWLLLGISGLVLTIACVNLANLLLARSTARTREYAVRMALGASRVRVVSQLFWESLLIALGGAVGGAGLAVFLSKAVVRFLNTQTDTIELNLGFDWRVALFIAAVAIAASVGFGLSTALYATRAQATRGANAGTRNATLDRRRFSFQRVLISGQIAISLVLVVASLLFARSFRNLLQTDVGFQQEGLGYFFADFSRLGLSKENMKPYADALAGRVRALPGIESAALTTHVPLVGGGWGFFIRVAGHQDAPTDDTFCQFVWTSPDFFSTVGIPLLSGREVTELDSAAAPRILVVNEQFVRKYFEGRNPIGQTVRSLAEPGYPETLYRIVGVVKSTKHISIEDTLLPIAYAPDLQHPDVDPYTSIVVRSSMAFPNMRASVREALRQADPRIRLNASVDLRQQVLDELSRERLLAWLSGFFGVLAVVLATIGLYGVVSYMVSARRNEIGIRIALGATSRNVMGMILRQTAILLTIGLAAGAAASFALSQSVASLLFELRPGDPVTLISAMLLLIAIGLAASWVPAKRSARLDPNTALRED